MPSKELIPIERITQSILLIRGHRVILDSDLAALYGVQTKRLNEQVRRNIDRFPSDFMFELSKQEFANLKSQIETSSWGGRRKPPLAFTEHGALMAASVLKTPVAIHVSVQVVRSFIRLREMLATNRELARKLDTLEKKYDRKFMVVFDAIRKLMEPPEPTKKRRIGF